MRKLDVLMVTGSDYANEYFLQNYDATQVAYDMVKEGKRKMMFKSENGEEIIAEIFTDIDFNLIRFLYSKVIKNHEKTGIHILSYSVEEMLDPSQPIGY